MPDPRPARVIDPDVDLHDRANRRELRPRQWDLLAAIAAGGVLGAEARYGLAIALPHTGGQFPWSTVLTNVSGCLLIGVLMVVLLELAAPHRLLRPFLGVGVLGGYTTYSTFAVDVQRLLLAHRPLLALGYLAATGFGCALAVWLATALTGAAGRVLTARSAGARR
ncbi:MAG TPA: CrcB family protein [Jatrophihabitans sp.]|nr:CrcB family protein [Jatrophihabitans sp.]